MNLGPWVIDDVCKEACSETAGFVKIVGDLAENWEETTSGSSGVANVTEDATGSVIESASEVIEKEAEARIMPVPSEIFRDLNGTSAQDHDLVDMGTDDFISWTKEEIALAVFAGAVLLAAGWYVYKSFADFDEERDKDSVTSDDE